MKSRGSSHLRPAGLLDSDTIRYRMKLVNTERERQENKDKGGTRDVDAYMRTRKLKF